MGEDVETATGHAAARGRQAAPAISRNPAAQGLKDALGEAAGAQAGDEHVPKEVRSAPRQEVVWEGDEVDLAKLPIQHCWPGDAAPLITWGLVTRGPEKRQNLGIHRQQVLGRNKVIMRWLAHRGGALDFATTSSAIPAGTSRSRWLGCDPATILGAVTPVPDSISGIPVRRAAARRQDRAGQVLMRLGARLEPRSSSKA